MEEEGLSLGDIQVTKKWTAGDYLSLSREVTNILNSFISESNIQVHGMDSPDYNGLYNPADGAAIRISITNIAHPLDVISTVLHELGRSPLK